MFDKPVIKLSKWIDRIFTILTIIFLLLLVFGIMLLWQGDYESGGEVLGACIGGWLTLYLACLVLSCMLLYS